MIISELFAPQRDHFRQQVRTAATPDQAVAHARHALDRLQLDCQARTDLTPMQARLMPYVFDMLKSAVAVLLAASETHVWEKKSSEPEAPKARKKFLYFFNFHLSNAFWWKVAQGVLGFLLLSNLWNGGLYFSFLLMLVLLFALFADHLPFDWHFLPENRRSRLQAEVQLDVQVFMLKFDDVLITADKVLGEAGRHASADPIREGDGLEAYPRLLAWCQDVLEAKDFDDSTYALKKARELPDLLATEGIETQHYQGDNAAYFDLLPSLDPNDTDIQTLTPALVRNGRLVSQGRATEPRHAD